MCEIVARMQMRADVLVVGGGLGGVAAALAAAGRGLDVVMSEPSEPSTRWQGTTIGTGVLPTAAPTARTRSIRPSARAMVP